MSFTFVDLCSGIGGGRLGLELCGGQCLAFSEIDDKAINTYKSFFGDKDKFLGDLTLLSPEQIPDTDLIIAGFPCQTFSINGKRKGFDDYRGQIIFYISEILKNKKIKYFILENVKGLVNHNQGKTFNEILQLLDNVGYNVYHKILNSYDYGLPQSRERVYFVGIRKDLKQTPYIFPEKNKSIPALKNYLIDDREEFLFNKYDTLHKYLHNKYNKGRIQLDELLKEDFLIIDTRQSDLRLYRGYIPTLRAGRSGLLYVRNGKLRCLSGGESLLLQGFSKKHYHLTLQNPNSRLLAQTGNAMSVNVISALTKQLLPIIKMNNE